jgi:glycosyltransferase involved in cell wall biosynthesis
LLLAFKQVNLKYSNSSLLIVGDGEFKNECENIVNAFSIKNVVMENGVDDNNFELKAEIFCSCDVFVLPSTILGNKTEGWGLTVGEAMSCSKPVLVTDAVGCSEDFVKNGKNGYVVGHGSVDELIKGMEKFILNSDKIKIMGKNSRKIFDDKNSYSVMANSLVMGIDSIKK